MDHTVIWRTVSIHASSPRNNFLISGRIFLMFYEHVVIGGHYTYVPSNVQVNPWSEVLLEKLIVAHLVKNPKVHYHIHKSPHVPMRCTTFRKKFFYTVELLASRPTLNLEDRPLSAVRNCLFNVFAASVHILRPSPPSATRGRAMSW
jgi:hypothetical protein